MKTRTFSRVRVKREGAEQIMLRLAGKTLQEQLEYWQKETEELKKHQQTLVKN